MSKGGLTVCTRVRPALIEWERRITRSFLRDVRGAPVGIRLTFYVDLGRTDGRFPLTRHRRQQRRRSNLNGSGLGHSSDSMKAERGKHEIEGLIGGFMGFERAASSPRSAGIVSTNTHVFCRLATPFVWGSMTLIKRN